MMFIALLILLGTLLVFLETVLVGGIWCAMGLACYGGDVRCGVFDVAVRHSENEPR